MLGIRVSFQVTRGDYTHGLTGNRDFSLYPSTDQGPTHRGPMSVGQMRTSEYEREDRNQLLCSVQGSRQGSLQRGPSLKKEGVLPTPPSLKMVVLGAFICTCDQN